MTSKDSICPSAPWNSANARIFGVVAGDARAPRVMFLKELLTPSKALEDKLGGVSPDKVFRVAAPCAGAACTHHDSKSASCKLVERVVEYAEVAYEDYSVCKIRASCVWWEQQGLKACQRCPQIATRNSLPGEKLALAARPV